MRECECVSERACEVCNMTFHLVLAISYTVNKDVKGQESCDEITDVPLSRCDEVKLTDKFRD